MKRRTFIKSTVALGSLAALPVGTIASCSGPKARKEVPYSFDEIIDRSGTWSIKASRAKDGQIPMWIADMDFKTAPCVSRALHDRIDRDVMGYTYTPDDFTDAIASWIKARHGWDVDREWINYAPGVITGINQAYLTFSSPGDKIIVQPPVYDHFRLYIERLGRQVVDNPLILEDGQYRMDFERLETLFDERTKLLVLCNPNNPGGIAWSRDDLARLAEICSRHCVLVISDEIHCDLSLGTQPHVPFCSVSETAARIGMMFSGPTKTFNLAGLTYTAYCVIPDETIRRKYTATLSSAKLDEAPIMSIVATIAAFTKGNEWRESLLSYLRTNVDTVVKFFNERDLGIKAMSPQASFLVWLDCRGTGLSQKELMSRFSDDAGIVLSNGESYGVGGEGFVRLNIGCPRAVLNEALERIEKAFQR